MALFAIDLDASPLVILCGYLFFSPAFTATIASLNNETSRILPKKLIGSGLGFMQLIQFFGGSFSVAVCGLILSIQDNVPLVQAYRHVYGLLFFISTISLTVILWYGRSVKTAKAGGGGVENEL